MLTILCILGGKGAVIAGITSGPGCTGSSGGLYADSLFIYAKEALLSAFVLLWVDVLNIGHEPKLSLYIAELLLQ